MLKRTAFFAAMLLLAATGRAGAQGVDSCLTNYHQWAHSTNFGGDSLMIDTCPDSPTYLQGYSKGPFEVEFDYYMIQTPISDTDTIYVTWQAIDTNYPKTCASFAALDSEFGSFTMKKEAPWQTDTGYFGNHIFLLTFSNYVPVDSSGVIARFDSIPECAVFFEGDTGFAAGVKEEPPHGFNVRVWPQPAGDWIRISGIPLGSHFILETSLGEGLSLDIAPEENDYYLNVSKLRSGLYFLTGGNRIIRFIIEH